MFLLTDDVTKINGIGSKKKQLLSSMEIETIGSLLNYFPYKYKDRRNIVRAIDATEDKECLVSGKLISYRLRPISRNRSMVECIFQDESITFSVVFFNMPFLKNKLKTGTIYVLFGKMKNRNGMRVWTNPEFCILGDSRDERGILPIYRCPPGITSSSLSKIIRTALDNTHPEEWINKNIIKQRHICSPEYAFRNIHYPENEQAYKFARYRIIYEQLLKYQLAIRMTREQNEKTLTDASVQISDISEFTKNLPFTLTEGQMKCIQEITADLERKTPMNRLIQGDVGCGKTVVAEAAIWECATVGLQSAMMAPTEILARQHYERLSKDFAVYGMKVALLVSGMKASERRDILAEIKSGEISIVVGTHALIQNDVEFDNLALVITDEQHRFGVNQRKALTRKGRSVNVCVMSATPIPRTLAATVFGDMDFSIIRTKPAERKTIITRALNKSSRERAYTAAAQELKAGNLVYIIAPSIDSEDDDLSSVNKLYDEVKAKLRGFKVALIHGRLSKEEKESIMNDFAAGKVQILVATVVIEVGIDVPDATMIIIENSERFGLAQLHQLRGRVGRSDKQSYCFLINYGKSESSAERAKAMVETSDGFEISEKDYELRGPGDIMGTLQSGAGGRNILSLCTHTDILEAAIEDADCIMNDKSGTDLSVIQDYMITQAETDNSDII